MASLGRKPIVNPLNVVARILHPQHKQARTLGRLAQEKMALVAVCRTCKHRRVLYMPRLIERFGQHFAAIALRPHLRSTKCRRRSPNLHESAR
jgi:hypothetical protein